MILTLFDSACLPFVFLLGWWFVNTDYDQGWVPSSYLEREDGSTENRVIKSTYKGDRGKPFLMKFKQQFLFNLKWPS